ncbi:MAG TPA: HDOD domain-containing protein [Polyangiaceae bacterium]|nr:HDOD domain-containing protein [Polyangiaceae bacterium]
MEGTHTVMDESKRGALVERLTEFVRQRITQGTLVLPPMPVAAFDCLELLRQPDFSMREAARVIEQDPSLAARVLSVSNSAVFGRREKARNIVQAATRLGGNNLRVVLFDAVAVPIFESNDARLRQTCNVLWQHARAVAAGARLAALVASAGDPGEAYLGGLLHDIGKPVVAALLIQAERRLAGSGGDFWLEPENWLQVVGNAHRPVGVSLAQRWKLPESVIHAIGNCVTYDGVERCSIVNCVRLANALAKQAGIYVGPVDERDVAETVRAGQSMLGVSDADLGALRAAMCEPAASG